MTIDDFDGLFAPVEYRRGRRPRAGAGNDTYGFAVPLQGIDAKGSASVLICTQTVYRLARSTRWRPYYADLLRDFADTLAGNVFFRRHLRALHLDGWHALHVLWDGAFAAQACGPSLTEQWQAVSPTPTVHHHVAAEWWRFRNMVPVPVEP